MSTTNTYRGMNRTALDAAYNNAAAVSHSGAMMQAFNERSAELRAAHPGYREIQYGPAPRNRIDYLPADRPGPLLVFIHGGYWQMRSKDDFGFLAAGPLAHGVHVALIGYTLAPDASLTEIVAEVRAAIGHLHRDERLSGVDRQRILVSGWSAGGHLTALCMNEPGVIGGIAISGIYDLAPVRLSYLNDKLQLTEQEVEALSPQQLPIGNKPLALVYGGDELPELQRQSIDFADARHAVPSNHLAALTGHNHFTILEELAAPDGAITRMMTSML